MIEMLLSPLATSQTNKAPATSIDGDAGFMQMMLEPGQNAMAKELRQQLPSRKGSGVGTGMELQSDAQLQRLQLFFRPDHAGEGGMRSMGGSQGHSAILPEIIAPSLPDVGQAPTSGESNGSGSEALLYLNSAGNIKEVSAGASEPLGMDGQGRLVSRYLIRSSTHELVHQSVGWGLRANQELSQWQWFSTSTAAVSASEIAVTVSGVKEQGVSVSGDGSDTTLAVGLMSAVRGASLATPGTVVPNDKHQNIKSVQVPSNTQSNMKWALPVEQAALFVIDRSEGEALLSIRNFFLSDDREKQLRDNLVEFLGSKLRSGINRIRINGVEVWRSTR